MLTRRFLAVMGRCLGCWPPPAPLVGCQGITHVVLAVIRKEPLPPPLLADSVIRVAIKPPITCRATPLRIYGGSSPSRWAPAHTQEPDHGHTSMRMIRLTPWVSDVPRGWPASAIITCRASAREPMATRPDAPCRRVWLGMPSLHALLRLFFGLPGAVSAGPTWRRSAFPGDSTVSPGSASGGLTLRPAPRTAAAPVQMELGLKSGRHHSLML